MHYVRYWHKADITTRSTNVRLWGKADVAVKLLMRDARRIAANIAKLPELLGSK